MYLCACVLCMCMRACECVHILCINAVETGEYGVIVAINIQNPTAKKELAAPCRATFQPGLLK